MEVGHRLFTQHPQEVAAVSNEHLRELERHLLLEARRDRSQGVHPEGLKEWHVRDHSSS